MNGKRQALSHDQVALLMPAFIRSKLSSESQRRVQEHIAACPACANLHQEGLDLSHLLDESPPGLETLLTPAHRERNRRQVIQRIHQSRFHELEDGEPWTGRKRSRLSASGSAAIAAGLCALIVGLMLLPQGRDPANTDQRLAYQTRSSGSAQLQGGYTPSYRVVFQLGETRESIRQSLLALNAVVLDGPSVAGVYTLEFSAREEPTDQILSRLRQRPEILLAEPSVHRDR